jgi:hypothetical protein
LRSRRRRIDGATTDNPAIRRDCGAWHTTCSSSEQPELEDALMTRSADDTKRPAFVPKPLTRPSAVPRPTRLPSLPPLPPLGTKAAPRVTPPPLPARPPKPIASPEPAAIAAPEPAPLVIEATPIEPLLRPSPREQGRPTEPSVPIRLMPSADDDLEPAPASRRALRYGLAVAAALFGAPALFGLLGFVHERGSDRGAVARAIAEARNAAPAPMFDGEPLASRGSEILGDLTSDGARGEPAHERAPFGPDGDARRVGRPFDRAAAARLVATEARTASARCPETGRARVGVVFAPSGHTKSVWLEGSPSDTCLARALRELRVEPFDGEPTTVEVSVWLR